LKKTKKKSSARPEKLKAKTRKPRKHNRRPRAAMPKLPRSNQPIFSDKALDDFLLGSVADLMLITLFRPSGLRQALIDHLAKNPPPAEDIDAEFIDPKEPIQ
jgi:hypothetical protein